MWNSSLRLRKMYFCCLTEAGNKKWPSVEQTHWRSIWLTFQAESSSIKQFWNANSVAGYIFPLALVCRGKKKVKKYAETTRFVLSNDSRLRETEVFRTSNSRRKTTNNANYTSQRFVEEAKTIFLCFRLPLRRKWRWRAVWTLIKVVRTFLSNG